MTELRIKDFKHLKTAKGPNTRSTQMAYKILNKYFTLHNIQFI